VLQATHELIGNPRDREYGPAVVFDTPHARRGRHDLGGRGSREYDVLRLRLGAEDLRPEAPGRPAPRIR